MQNRTQIINASIAKLGEHAKLSKNLASIQNRTNFNYAGLVKVSRIRDHQYLLADLRNLFYLNDINTDIHTAFSALLRKRRTTTRGTILCPITYPRIASSELCYDIYKILYPQNTYQDYLKVLLHDVDTLYTIDLQWHKNHTEKQSVAAQTKAVMLKVKFSEASEQLEHMNPNQLLIGNKIKNNYIFCIPEVITGEYPYFRLVYNLLSAEYPELYKQIKLSNLNAKVIYDKVELLEQQGLTIGEQIEKLSQGIVIGGEKNTGRMYAHPYSRKAFKNFVDFINACTEDDKKAIMALADISNGYKLQTVYNDLDHGRCVETASLQLKGILCNKANQPTLNKVALLDENAKKQLIQQINYLGKGNAQTENHTIANVIEEAIHSLSIYSSPEHNATWGLETLLQTFHKHLNSLTSQAREKVFALQTNNGTTLQTIIDSLKEPHVNIKDVINQLNNILCRYDHQAILDKETTTENANSNLILMNSLENSLNDDGIKLDNKIIPTPHARNIISKIDFRNIDLISQTMSRFNPEYFHIFAEQQNILNHILGAKDLAKMFFWFNESQSREFCKQFERIFKKFSDDIESLADLIKKLIQYLPPFHAYLVIDSILANQIVDWWSNATDIKKLYSLLTSKERDLIYLHPKIKQLTYDIVKTYLNIPYFLQEFLTLFSPNQCQDICATFFINEKFTYNTFYDYQTLISKLDKDQHAAVVPCLAYTIDKLLADDSQKYLLFDMYTNMSVYHKSTFGKILINSKVKFISRYADFEKLRSILIHNHLDSFYQSHKLELYNIIKKEPESAKYLGQFLPIFTPKECAYIWTNYFQASYYVSFDDYENIIAHLSDDQYFGIHAELEKTILRGLSNEISFHKLTDSLKLLADDNRKYFYAKFFMIHLVNKPIRPKDFATILTILNTLAADDRLKFYNAHINIFNNCLSHFSNQINNFIALFKPEQHETLYRKIFSSDQTPMYILENYENFTAQCDKDRLQILYPYFKHALVTNICANPKVTELFNAKDKDNFVKYIADNLTFLEITNLLAVDFDLFFPLVQKRLLATTQFVDDFFIIYNQGSDSQKISLFKLFENKFFNNLTGDDIKDLITQSHHDQTFISQFEPLMKKYVDHFKASYKASKPITFFNFTNKLRDKPIVQQFEDIQDRSKEKEHSHTHKMVEQMASLKFNRS